MMLRRVLQLGVMTCGVAAGLAASGASASTVLLDFEDRSGLSFGQAIPSDYHGINFSGDFTTYSDPQDPYNPSSPPTRAATNRLGSGFGSEVRFSFVNPDQVFDGAYFAGGSGTVSFNLYNDAVLVASSLPLGLSGTPTFLSSGYAGPVDEVGIFGNKGFYTFDDLQYQTEAATAVPVPGAAWAGFALFGGLGVARIRRMRESQRALR